MLLLKLLSYSQTETLYSSYLFNGLSINPGYAGYHECLNANLWGKKQWSGIKGAPQSFLLSAHTPLPQNKIAVGINIFNESYGVSNQSGLSGIYAYRIRLHKKFKLSAGLQAGLINTSIDYNSVSARMPGDPAFARGESRFAADFAGGVVVSSDRFFGGISAAHLQQNVIKRKDRYEIMRKQYFLMAGYILTLSKDARLKPSVLIRATERSGLQFDVNLSLSLRNVLWTGISYRSTQAFIIQTQIKLNSSLDVGYAVDIYSRMSAQRNFISHELMLNYRFHFKDSEIISPRYF